MLRIGSSHFLSVISYEFLYIEFSMKMVERSTFGTLLVHLCFAVYLSIAAVSSFRIKVHQNLPWRSSNQKEIHYWKGFTVRAQIPHPNERYRTLKCVLVLKVLFLPPQDCFLSSFSCVYLLNFSCRSYQILVNAQSREQVVVLHRICGDSLRIVYQSFSKLPGPNSLYLELWHSLGSTP